MEESMEHRRAIALAYRLRINTITQGKAVRRQVVVEAAPRWEECIVEVRITVRRRL